MEWHELAFAALLVLAALAVVGWISRQLQRPLEWMIDSQIDPPSVQGEAPADGSWSVQSISEDAARDVKLQRGW